MQRTGRAAATMLALVGLAISACSSSGQSSDASASTTPSRSTAPATATATATKPDAAHAAGSQVVALVPLYLQVIDDLYLNPSRSLDDIYQVAIAPDAVTEATAIGKFRAKGYRQTGRSRVVTATAESVDLGSGSAASPSSALPTVVVTACIDVGQVDAVDTEGKSIVPPGRPRYLVEQLTVVNLHFPDASTWRVSNATNKQAQSCSG